MPGIVGVIGKNKAASSVGTVELMVKSLMHEASYTNGLYVNDQLGLCAGWTCHKNSFSDCLPVTNETNDVILFFAGENYADRQTLHELKTRGHSFDPDNASYIIHLYEEEGEKFINRLNGWFGGLLVDTRQKKAILFNDRYAMQRIYYYERKDAFFFSSEAKALLKVCPELREMDLAGVGEFLSCGCTLQNKSMFSGVNTLPGGVAWAFEGGRINRRSYFDFSTWENQAVLGSAAFYDGFEETFRNILPRYFQSKEQVAMSLTGGLDTRMIMASISPRPGALPCYTFGGMYRDCYDTRVARQIASVYQQPYSLFKLDGQFLKDFPKHVEETIYITDGCVDASVSHEIYFTRMANAIAPIRMTGNYGSEVLRSVNYIKATPPVKGLLHPDFAGHIQDAVNAFSQSVRGHQLTYAVTKLIPWHLFGRLAAAQSQLTVRTPYMDNDIVGLLYRAPGNVRNSSDLSRRLIREGNPELARIMTDRGVSIDSGKLVSKIMRVYREVLFKVEYVYNEGTPDWLVRLDHAMRPLHLERIMLGHHKIENYRFWFRSELAKYLQSMIIDEKTLSRPYWDRRFLETMVDNHIKGRRNHIQEINKVLAIELIHRTLLENN